jgi:hypothetical protein
MARAKRLVADILQFSPTYLLRTIAYCCDPKRNRVRQVKYRLSSQLPKPFDITPNQTAMMKGTSYALQPFSIHFEGCGDRQLLPSLVFQAWQQPGPCHDNPISLLNASICRRYYSGDHNRR